MYRAASYKEVAGAPEGGFDIFLAIFHGVFSLIMFIALLAFIYAAWKSYKKGINFLREHKKLSTVFLIAWMIAILSGYLFFLSRIFNSKD